jgi:hypothetical protein
MNGHYNREAIEKLAHTEPSIRAYLDIHEHDPINFTWEETLMAMVIVMAQEKKHLFKHLLDLHSKALPTHIVASQEAIDALKLKADQQAKVEDISGAPL